MVQSSPPPLAVVVEECRPLQTFSLIVVTLGSQATTANENLPRCTFLLSKSVPVS
jgi:hypothetical protein